MQHLLSFLLFLLPLSLVAQQPKEANRALVTLTAYDAQGQLLQSTNGFFCSPTGDVLLPYALLKGAARVEVVDAQGRTAQVQRVVGASSGYDLARVTTNIPTRKLVYLSSAIGGKDAKLWQTYYTTQRKELPQPVSLLKEEALDTLQYYTISSPNEARYLGTPLVDERGKVVAIVQKNVQKNATTACAIDARAMQVLEQSTSANALFSSDLRSLSFAPLLPSHNEEQAYSALFLTLLSPADTLVASTMAQDFLQLYPQNTDVYAPLASFHSTKRGDYATAHSILRWGLSRPGDHRAKLYGLLSDLMKQKAQTDTLTAPRWSLQDALFAADSAYALRPDTIFMIQQAELLLLLGRTAEALPKWQAINASSRANWETILKEAQCLEILQGDSAQTLSLLDRAIARMEEQQNIEPQLYLLRGNYLVNADKHRRAVADFLSFEKALPAGQHPKANFYAQRSMIERSARMYQQALDDLDMAINLATSVHERADYLLEKANLLLTVGLFAEAQQPAQEILAISKHQSHQAEAHRALGISFGERKQRNKAQQHLRQAQFLGDSLAADLLKRYATPTSKTKK